MKRTIRIPIKINRKEDLLQCMKIYGEIFDRHVDWAFENKTYNKNKAHKSLYHKLRSEFPNIPSVFIQTARDQALESIKASKFKRKPKKKKFTSIRHTPRSFTLRGDQLTFSCIGKRIKTIIKIPEYSARFQDEGKVCGSTVSYDGVRFWVNLVFNLPDVEKIDNRKVIGIDRGIYNLVMTSEGKRYGSEWLRASQRRNLYNRRTLQSKGTRSARRRLKSMSGREKRFSKNVNHCISKQVAELDCGVFVLEDLSGITNRRKGRRLNKWLHSWPFYQFQMFLEYKAAALGKSVVYVNPRNTSKLCNCCGKFGSRDGGRFSCSCGYSNHADLNAALNIRDKYLLSLETKAGSCQSAECSLET